MAVARPEDIVEVLPAEGAGSATVSDIVAVEPSELPPIPGTERLGGELPGVPVIGAQIEPVDKWQPVKEFATEAEQVAFTPAPKAAGGATLTEVYDLATDTVATAISKVLGGARWKSQKRELAEDFPAVVLINELVRGIPELADFAMSPGGAATLKLQAARPVVRAFVNAAFATQMGKNALEELQAAKANPTPQTIGRSAKAVTIALLPWLHAARTEVGNQRLSQKLGEAEITREYEPKVARIRIEKRRSREYRRALSAVPEEGIPEEVSRAIDARENLAQEVFQKPFNELSNPDRLAVDELVTEGYGFAVRRLVAGPTGEMPGARAEAAPTKAPTARVTETTPVPEKPTTAKPGPLQPWQQTLEEYAARFQDVTPEKLRGAHEHLVRQAVREGQKVPDRVLEQYPRAIEMAKPIEGPPPEGPPIEAEILGERGRAFTPRETPIDFQYAVSEVDVLTTSFDAGYDAALQPRDIARKGSRQRVEQRKSDLNPAKMGESVNAGDGAPITRPDGMVVTRNHGVQALKELYQANSERSKAYKEWLAQNAERFGLDREKVAGMNRPVLHRMFTEKLDRAGQVRLAEEANMPTVAAMSEAEQAQMLAKRLTGPMMDAFEVSEEGTPSPQFVQAFLSDLPVEMQAAFSDNAGRLSQSGLRAIRNAIFAKAYPDTAAIERLAEAADSNVRNISNGMLDAAPKFARLQEGIERGELWDLNIGPELSKAASTLSALRDQRTTIDDYLKQGDLFGRDPLESRLIEVLGENRRSAKKIGGILKEHAEFVEKVGSPKQETMFGPPRVPSKLEVFDAAYERFKEISAQRGAETPSLFEEGPAGGPGATGVEAAARPAGETTPGVQPGAVAKTVLEVADRLEKEGKRLIEEGSAEGGVTLGAGLGAFNPQATRFSGYVLTGTAKLMRGTVDFARWSAEMLRDFGDTIKPYLRDIYDEARRRFNLAQQIGVDDYFNFRRAAISDEMKATLRARVAETIVKTGRFPKERVSFQQIRDDANRLDPAMVKELQPFQQAQGEYRAVRDLTRRVINEQNQKIYDLERKLEREAPALTSDQLIARERELDGLRRDNQGLLDVWMRMRSDDGRNLAMHRMMADDAVARHGGFDLTYWVTRARRAMGLPAGVQLPDTQHGKLAPVIAEGQRAWDAAVKKAKRRTARTTAQQQPSPTGPLPEGFTGPPGRTIRGFQPEFEETAPKQPPGPIEPVRTTTTGDVQRLIPGTEPLRSKRIETAIRQRVSRLERAAAEATGESTREALTPEERFQVENDPRVIEAKRKLAKVMREIQQTGFLEAVTALRKAGLLTGPKTSGRNVGGNLSFQLLEELARIPAAVADMAIALHTGERTVQGVSPGVIWTAASRAAHEGIRQGFEIMRHGVSQDQMNRMLDIAREVNVVSERHPILAKTFNSYVNGVFRFMAAQDRVFKIFAAHRSLQEQASLIARNERKAGRLPAGMTEGQRVRELYDRPSETMQINAIAAAEFATFNNRNIIASEFTRAMRSLEAKGPAGKALSFAGQNIVLFANTPSNIMARVFDYTPLGAGARLTFAPGKEITPEGMRIRQLPSAEARREGREVASKLTPEAQRTVSMALGRGMVGAALLALGWYLAEDGSMTGTREEEEGERTVSEAARRLPGAVLVGGKWRQVAPFSPFGNVLTLGATMQRELSRPNLNIGVVGTMGAVALDTVLEQPLMKGIHEVERLRAEPGSYAGQYIGSVAGSFVPTAVANIAEATDVSRRQLFGQGVMAQFRSRVPGLRQTLPERTDILGRVMKQHTSQSLDPTLAQPGLELSDPIIQELIGNHVKIGWPDKLHEIDETDEEKVLRGQLVGVTIEKHLGREITKGSYQEKAAGEERRLALEKAIHNAQEEVSRRVTRRKSYREGSHDDRLVMLQDEIYRARSGAITTPRIPTAPAK